MAHETTGTIHALSDAVKVSDRFTKREFVLSIADNPKYPQLVQFEATGDRIGQLDGLSVGDKVRIEFSLRGREWKSPKGETKYFNSLSVWAVALVGERAAPPPEPNGGGWGAPPPQVDDDIPFASAEIEHEPSSVAAVLRWR